MSYTELSTGKRSEKYEDLPVPFPGYDSIWSDPYPHPPKLLRKNGPVGLARFADALPPGAIPRSLGEGGTPLTPSRTFPDVYIKNEGLNPTGSFKDRESVVALAVAAQQGWQDLAIVSSGNAALSGALYAKAYGMSITCFVPKGTSSGKLGMIELFGGKAHVVGENYEDTYHHVLENLPKGTVNITSGVFPPRVEGFKTIAYEIWEQLGAAPGAVVCPVANGSALAGIYKGFEELRQWGLTDSVPAMVCVQVTGADPVVRAFECGEWVTPLSDIPDSMSEAIVAMESYCSPKAVHALRESGGLGLTVDDDQTTEGVRFAINEEGVFPEFSSGAAFAAVREHHEQIAALGGPIVVISSGSGLKEIQALQKVLA
jgi:threonine synthase